METELKGNGELSFYGVNYIITGIQEIGKSNEEWTLSIAESVKENKKNFRKGVNEFRMYSSYFNIVKSWSRSFNLIKDGVYKRNFL